MTPANRHDGAAATGRRRVTVALLLAAAPLVFSGCHDEERLRQRLEGPTARLPVEPDQPTTPPAPALLDTVRPWRQPAPYDGNATDTWDIEDAPAGGDVVLTYRVPRSWRNTTPGDGRTRNRTRAVEAYARVTNLDDGDISLATYAAQLAEGNPIWQYATSDGHVVYLTRREVTIAPSETHAPREIFHTAVVSIDGRIAKLDVRYDSDLDWRFDELAGAISGTLQVRARTT